MVKHLHQDYRTHVDPVKIVTLRRNELQLNQKQLAELIKVNSPNFISIVEAGKSKLPIENLNLWADALEMDRKWFIEKVLRDRYPEIANTIFGDEDDKDKKLREEYQAERMRAKLEKEQAKIDKMRTKLES